MKTSWGETLDVNNILPEYPRPQMKRARYLILNGAWEYAITKAGDEPEAYDGTILVPFSPECELSGVMRQLSPCETLWYRRTFARPSDWPSGRTLLHFGAVDQTAEVFLNGHKLGSHTGGYAAFSFDMTELIREDNVLTVKVTDVTDASHHARGKQKTARGGIWYTPQSGIWQTVWAEPIPEAYVERLRIVPLFDESAVEITAFAAGGEALPYTVRFEEKRVAGTAGAPVRLALKSFTPWSPENPKLYEFEVDLGEDTVQSYFAMRKFSVEKDGEDIPRLFLNNRPYFHNGVLDQGYWPDGLYTAPSDEAMVADILTMKRLGFNTLRKHIKIEPMRWYYHCDRLGMLVWQDMPNGGGRYRSTVVSLPALVGSFLGDEERSYRRFAREDAAGRAQYSVELREMIHQLVNCPSIAVWVPFNEGWGQFDAKRAYGEILAIDATRTIDHASGWHDQGVGEIQSLHIYFRPYRHEKDRLGRVVLLSEFGGYNCRVSGHCFNEKDFGYRRFQSAGALLAAFRALYENEIIPAKGRGLAAAIYTQLSDVEDELNGFLTYDRAVAKLPEAEVRALMDRLCEEN
ncbi:MAG TPA: glycoside hydrolase family 2 TIM barrel-domain containing protein [Clostridia bacterium]|nr:glycoside hydrolase family 2 TIM barrel-domain containing protein [Clostridia bacterium]